MKKAMFLLFAVVFVSSLFAKKADLFHYEHHRVDLALTTVNQIDRIVTQNNWDLNELQQNFNAARSGLLSQLPDDEKLLGIPGFVWGGVMALVGGGIGCFAAGNIGIWIASFLIGGLIGTLMVYLVTESKKQTEGALIGCVASTAVSVGLAFLLALSIVAAAQS